MRFEVRLPANAAFATAGAQSQVAASGVVSPDGRRIVFSAVESNGVPRLWVRDINSFAARPLDGTERALFPFWSTDGNAVAFFVQDANRLRK